MSTTLQASVRMTTQWAYSNGLSPGASISNDKVDYLASFAQGTGAGQADTLYVTYGTLSGSGTLNVDLNGAVSDFFGNTVAMARLKSMQVSLLSTTSATSILVGNGTNPFINWVGSSTCTVRVRNGGCLCLCAVDATAYAVTASTGDILKIANEDSVNVATYQLAFIGASA
jgi:hypothetical protein